MSNRFGPIRNIRSPWRVVICCALVGAALPFVIYAVSQVASGERFFESGGGLILLFCPPYFLSTVFDHTVASERIKTVISMSFANSVLYLFVGLVLATIRRDFET